MNPPPPPAPYSPDPAPQTPSAPLVSEFLLLPDGTMLAHHLTPVLAEALAHILFPKGIPAHSEPHAALRGHPKAAGRDPSTPALLP